MNPAAAQISGGVVLVVDDEAAWLRSLQLMLQRTIAINNVIACQDSRMDG